MDILMSVIFLIMFLTIIGVVIYLILDYMGYKDNVDTAFELTTSHMNDTFDKVSENISATADDLAKNINNNRKNITTLNVKTDAALERSYQVEDNIHNVQANVNKTDNDLNKFDTALKKYFKFSENNQGIVNSKIYNHVFNGINPNLELLTHVDAISGLTVKTLPNKSFNICNTNNNCINMQVNQNRFDITPQNVNRLTINAKNNTPLANFDLQNNSIYLGGNDINAPMFIQDENLYINNVNLLLKAPGRKYTNDDMEDIYTLRISGEDVYELGTSIAAHTVNIRYILVNMSPAMSQQTPAPSRGSGSPASIAPAFGSGSPASIAPAFGSGSPASIAPAFGSGSPASIAPAFGSGSPASNAPAFGSDSPASIAPAFGSDSPSTNPTSAPAIREAFTVAPVINRLTMSIRAASDLKQNDAVIFDIPSTVYGTFTGYSSNTKLYTIDNVSIAYINTASSEVNNKSDKLSFKIKMIRNIPKNTEILIQLYGNNIFSYVGRESKEGVAAGYIERA
jgi:hypothetical protein